MYDVQPRRFSKPHAGNTMLGSLCAKMWQARWILLVCIFFVSNLFIWKALEDDWSYIDCFYFICVTLTTIGFGDFVPSDDNSRIYCVFFIMVGLGGIMGVLAQYFDNMVTYLENRLAGRLRSDALAESRKHNLEGEKAEADDYWARNIKIVFSLGLILLAIGLGVVVVCEWNEWTFIAGLYWTVTTAMTIGYGDLKVSGDHHKLFTAFYCLWSTLCIASALGGGMEVFIEKGRRKKKRRLMDALNLVKMIQVDGGSEREGLSLGSGMDEEGVEVVAVAESGTSSKDTGTGTDADTASAAPPATPRGDAGGVDKIAFLIFMLENVAGVDRTNDIDPFLEKFDELDGADGGTGKLSNLAIMNYHHRVVERRTTRLQARRDAKGETVFGRMSLAYEDFNEFMGHLVYCEGPAPGPAAKADAGAGVADVEGSLVGEIPNPLLLQQAKYSV